MNIPSRLVLGVFATWLCASLLQAGIQVDVEHNDNESATAEFRLAKVPAASQTDAAAAARVVVVEGRLDPNGGGVTTLCDGQLPASEDQPASNCFFAAGTKGGRILIDLQNIASIQRVNTYSWHPAARGPQVYRLYAADGMAPGFALRPEQGTNPESCGWKHIADVDTWPQAGAGGGQYGVSVSDSEGALGRYRYLLFDIAATEATGPYGNTFYSEIDVDDGTVHKVETPTPPEPRQEIVTTESGGYQITIDTTETPDLTTWVHDQLAPVVREWYPKIVTMLPSAGFEPPGQVTITFRAHMRGVAATGGTDVRCAASWMSQNLEGEAKGAIVHELVHVVQQYGRARRRGGSAAPTPGWLVEGIADYIRWFLYEPESHGADINTRNAARARYDAGYRVSANFLNWVVQNHDKPIIAQLNAAAREGRYQEDLWKELTGRTVQELGEDWKAALSK